MKQIYISESNNPYDNQILEHYFFYEYQEPILLLYVNEPCVVIGRHQNPWQEIHLNALYEKEMSFVRRLSGGGTVYHDLGNLNFAFFYNEGESKVKDNFDFIISRLKTLGVELSLTERNDLLYNNRKVSGNAFYRRGRRRLHHGTLLIDTDLKDLWSVLKFDHDDFTDKSVKSVKSPVVNLAHEFYGVDIQSVIDALSKDLMVIQEIEASKLLIDQYDSYEWLFGETPRFRYHFKGHDFLVKDGYIVESAIESLVNQKFDIEVIEKEL